MINKGFEFPSISAYNHFSTREESMKKMMITVLLIISNSVWAVPDMADVIKNTLLPQGYTLKDWATGDLDKDGIDDLVFVGDETETGRRSLWVYLMPENNRKLFLKSDKALLKADEGGIWGDPLSGISINKGSLFLKFYGGSNYRWSLSYQFQYRDAGLFLIGHDSSSIFTPTGEGEVHSYNLLNGKHQVIVTYDDGSSNEKWLQGKVGKLIRLKDFDISKDDLYAK